MNISFNITETWKRAEFRDFIKQIKSAEDITLYIITKDSNAASAPYVQDYLEMDSDKVIQCTNIATMNTALTDNNIQIHFDGEMETITDLKNLDDTINYIFVDQALTDSPGQEFINGQYIQTPFEMKYAAEFVRIIKTLI